MSDGDRFVPCHRVGLVDVIPVFQRPGKGAGDGDRVCPQQPERATLPPAFTGSTMLNYLSRSRRSAKFDGRDA